MGYVTGRTMPNYVNVRPVFPLYRFILRPVQCEKRDYKGTTNSFEIFQVRKRGISRVARGVSPPTRAAYSKIIITKIARKQDLRYVETGGMFLASLPESPPSSGDHQG